MEVGIRPYPLKSTFSQGPMATECHPAQAFWALGDPHSVGPSAVCLRQPLAFRNFQASRGRHKEGIESVTGGVHGVLGSTEEGTPLSLKANPFVSKSE